MKPPRNPASKHQTKSGNALSKHTTPNIVSYKKNAAASKHGHTVQYNDALFDFHLPGDAEKQLLEHFDQVIASNYPLTSRQQVQLLAHIRELSHLLTDERAERRKGYMNQTTTLSAYVHYYLWWNLVRLTRLFANLPASFFDIDTNAVCLDIGSGPLTVPLAMFIACPSLRAKKLTWYCLDISAQALSMGENIFLTVAAALHATPWTIVRVKGNLGTTLKKKASFITAANIFNELEDILYQPPDFLAKKYCSSMLAHLDGTSPATRVLVVEPGVPKGARLVSLLRDAFLRKGFIPCSPCPHAEQCPMDGKRGGKWCNYVFTTDDAPKKLKQLSESAHLGKERAVLSFVALEKNKAVPDYAPNGTQQQSLLPGKPSYNDIPHNESTEGPAPSHTQRGHVQTSWRAHQDIAHPDTSLTARIASDVIRLPGNRRGYYACSGRGLLLLVTDFHLASGQRITITDVPSTTSIDAKSGATLIDIRNHSISE